MRFSHWWRWPRRALTAFGGLTALILFTPLTVIWGGWLAGEWPDARGDVLIVLGGSSVENLLGESSYWRSVYAVRYYHAHHPRRIFLSGGPPNQPVAASMQRFLLASGVPGDVITVEPLAASTRENAERLAPLLPPPSGGGHPVLLTSDYHCFRARKVFARLGVPVRVLPMPDARKRGQRTISRWSAFCDLAVESCKIVYYYSKGWI